MLLKEAVTTLLAKYNDALNASSTNAAMPLYAEDGVLMPPYSPSAVGSRGAQESLRRGFSEAITLIVKFSIAEIVELAPEWAFARTNSAGTTLDHATGNQERPGKSGTLHFQEGQRWVWKIAPYSFSSTKSAQTLGLEGANSCRDESRRDLQGGRTRGTQGWRAAPSPTRSSGEGAMRVKAFGVNRSELFTRLGHSPAVNFLPALLGIQA